MIKNYFKIAFRSLWKNKKAWLGDKADTDLGTAEKQIKPFLGGQTLGELLLCGRAHMPAQPGGPVIPVPVDGREVGPDHPGRPQLRGPLR